MHYKCSRSEARRYLHDREAGGEPPEWLCHKFIAGNISELIEMTAMVILQLWYFIYISIFEDYDDQILKKLSCTYPYNFTGIEKTSEKSGQKPKK